MNYHWLGHLAYTLIAASFLVREILWLRVLATVASGFGIVYGVVLIEPPIIFWNSIFILINLVQIAIIIRDRMGVFFSPHERDIYDTMFNGAMSPVLFMKLLQIGQWKRITTDLVLTIAGERGTELILMYEGTATVLVNDKEVARLQGRRFIGEMSFTTGQPASATVSVSGPALLLVWSQHELHVLIKKEPQLRTGLQAVLASDMAAKLKVGGENHKQNQRPIAPVVRERD